MKKILVPTDFSEFAGYASELAAELAKKFDATLYFLHVVNIPTYEGLLPFSQYQNTPEGLIILRQVKKHFTELFARPYLQGVRVVEAIQMSEVYESITEAAEKHEIDLIVMGTHGSSGRVSDYFIGSNTDKIVRRTKTPILTVRERVTPVEFKKVVFAGDFNRDFSGAFYPIKNLVKLFGSHLNLLNVSTPSQFSNSGPMLKKMEAFALREGLDNYSLHLFNADDVQSGINEFSEMIGADLITTVTEGRKGLALLLNGSVTTDLMKTTHKPVLTVKI